MLRQYKNGSTGATNRFLKKGEWRRCEGKMKYQQMRRVCLRALCLTAILYLLGITAQAQTSSSSPAGKTRTYYVAAEESDWNYAPSGRDEAMGHPFDELEKGYAEPGPHRIGRIYKKVMYREYEDPRSRSTRNGLRKKPTSAFLVQFSAEKWATPSKSFSRTRLRVRTACIPTACSIRKIQRAPTTTTALLVRTRQMEV